MSLRLPVVGATAVYLLSATDAKGNNAPVENVVANLADSTLGTVAVEPDGGSYRITVTPTGPVGTTLLQISADAQIGDGETLLIASDEIEFVAGQATFLQLAGSVVQNA